MRILFFSDIMGRTGRDAVKQYMPFLKEKLEPDVILVNGENAAAGHGLTMKIAHEFFDLGVDAITTGNHVWAQKELLGAIDQEPRILRPLNYPEGTAGKGLYLHRLPDERKLLIVCLMGQGFMVPILNDPFVVLKEALAAYPLGAAVNAIFVDFHAESTAEKMALAHYMDGSVSALIGTHTHIPTADLQILEGGTAFQADAGMCGDFNSVIGSKPEASLFRYIKKMQNGRLPPAEGEATICATYIDVDDKTGRATHIDSVRLGGRLKQKLP
ncbi:MAG: TIGR00282 family metallophosphoesterase [Bdellovibrionales bacterium]